MSTFAVILAAAGKSSRFAHQHYKKPFAPLKDRAVWLHSADRFVNRDDVKQLIVSVEPEDREDFQAKFGANVAILGIEVVDGGATRSETVKRALAVVRDDVEFVAIHDAARPCLAAEWVDRVFAAARKSGAAILAVPVTATLKEAGAGQTVARTVPRDRLWEAQTPQVFRRDWLMAAYAAHGGEPATDDADVVQRAGHAVQLVQGSPVNLKITTREDLRLAEHALKALPKPKTIGPAHPFENDDMWR